MLTLPKEEKEKEKEIQKMDRKKRKKCNMSIDDFDEITSSLIKERFNNNIEKWCKYEMIFYILCSKYVYDFDVPFSHDDLAYNAKFFRNKHNIQFGCKFDPMLTVNINYLNISKSFI